jgi:hypothetical protein
VVRKNYPRRARMHEQKTVPVANLQMDTSNYRIGKQENQALARLAIIEEQGKKLVTMAEDIITYGLSPFDLPMVTPSNDQDGRYTIIEGNRRFTAIRLVQEPELARGTDLHQAFVKLNKSGADKVPTELLCVVVPSKAYGLPWIRRKHDRGLRGAGTEEWSAIARDRADADQDKPTPTFDALGFVESNAPLDVATRKKLAGSKFPITNLSRILNTAHVKDVLGITFNAGNTGKLSCTKDSKWVLDVLADIVISIATESYEGETFNESKIDTVDQREKFIDGLVKKHPRPKRAVKEWTISREHKISSTTPPKPPASPGTRVTPPTDARKTVIPRRFKLQLSDGKTNNIYDELKRLDVLKFTNSAAVLLRVFYEFSADAFLEKIGITFPEGKDSLLKKINKIIEHMKTNNIMTRKDLIPINTAISKPHSLISPVTLNAYVHNPSFNPDPHDLKRTWDNLQLFIKKMWE